MLPTTNNNINKYNFTANLLNNSLQEFPSGALLHSTNFLLVSGQIFPREYSIGHKQI
jgi:hypothetical protein